MIHKPIGSIEAADLLALVKNGVLESRTIEYKQKLPEGGDEAKKEFLADVSSFANGAGGYLIFGIVAKDGLPTSIPGLADFNEDKEVTRLESIIRDGVAPRIPGVRPQVVPSFDKGPVLVWRIPKSWASPHMVIFKNLSRFFTRNSAGKYQLDVTEIRSAFAMSLEIAERVKRWRDDRLGKLVADEGSVPLYDPSALVLHLIPLDSFTSENRVGVHDLVKHQVEFCPLGAGGWNPRVNVDGVLNYKTARDDDKARSYCQVFRSGRIESVYAGVVSERDGARGISACACERDIVRAIESCLKGLRLVDVPPPFIVCVSALGVKGASISGHWASDPKPIDRDVLLLPDILLESHDCDIGRELRPVFDALWNASGFVGSPSYDEDGSWNPNRR